MLKYYGMCPYPERLSDSDWARQYEVLRRLRKKERNDSLEDQAKLMK